MEPTEVGPAREVAPQSGRVTICDGDTGSVWAIGAVMAVIPSASIGRGGDLLGGSACGLLGRGYPGT